MRPEPRDETPTEDGGSRPDSLDLRLPLLGAVAWLGALTGIQFGRWSGLWWLGATAVLIIVSARVVRGGGRSDHGGTRLLVVCACGIFVALAAAAGLRVASVQSTPIADWAHQGAFVRAEALVTTDPRVHDGDYADFVVVRVRLLEAERRGERFRMATPVVVMADTSWSTIKLGSHVRFNGQLSAAREEDTAGVIQVRGSPDLTREPALWWRFADGVRTALSESVSDRPPDQRALVPALVVGDDSEITDSLSATFQATGLTHLLAVSGTNLTLLVGFVLWAARWCGVRGAGLYVVGPSASSASSCWPGLSPAWFAPRRWAPLA